MLPLRSEVASESPFANPREAREGCLGGASESIHPSEASNTRERARTAAAARSALEDGGW